MHLEAKTFTLLVRSLFPHFFSNGKKVLDVGSGDINGNNRELFSNCNYTGIDVAPGKNVDVVSRAGDFVPSSVVDGKVTDNDRYDVVVSTECFEHDFDFVKSIRNITFLVRPGGLFFFTCAGEGRGEHGTFRAGRDQSLSTQIDVNSKVWYPNYYRNLTAEDIQKALPVHLYYSSFSFHYNESSKDLYFWGLRNSTAFTENKMMQEQRNIQIMDNIYDRFNTDKGSFFHHYTKYYPTYLDKYRYQSGIKVLEIGVFRGESLKAVREYLKNAIEIVGIDINPACQQYQSDVDHIRVEIGDASNTDFLRWVNEKWGPFDIILDDGSHVIDDIATTFQTLFPLLRDGGVYIVEDTVVFRQLQNFQRKKVYGDHLSYFAQFTEFLNQWNHQLPNYQGDKGNCVDPEKIHKKTSNPLEYGIDRIIFGVSHIVVEKKVRKHWIA